MNKPKTVLIVSPKYNKKGRHDATGAFQVGASLFRNVYGLAANSVVILDNHSKAVEAKFLDALYKSPGKLDAFVYFGHGVEDGLSSVDTYVGRESKGRIFELELFAGGVLSAVREGGRLIFYACNAGALNSGGFAQNLHNMVGESFNIYAHVGPGHSYYRPYVTVFECGQPAGRYVIAPRSPLWSRWVKHLYEDTFWAKYPFMTQAEIDAVLAPKAAEAH